MLDQKNIPIASSEVTYQAQLTFDEDLQNATERTSVDVCEPPTEIPICRRVVTEIIGTAFLLIAITGSGILGERLADGNVAIALLANALASGATLFALIQWFAPISGAHFNPLVTLIMVWRGDVTRYDALAYMAAQVTGGIIGVGLANLMFDLPLYSLSQHIRSGPSQLLSEFVATFGLIGAVWTCSMLRPNLLAGVVATYIGGAFWFTASSFANPAVTIARSLTDTFSGIRPFDVPGFIGAQLIGALAAMTIFKWLLPSLTHVSHCASGASRAKASK